MAIMVKSKFKIKTVLVRCVIIAVVLMLAILFCSTLKLQNENNPTKQDSYIYAFTHSWDSVFEYNTALFILKW